MNFKNIIGPMKNDGDIGFYHARPMAFVTHGEVRQSKGHEDLHFKPTYEWLAKKLGFYSLFLAVGKPEDAIRITGYPNQFSRSWSAAMSSESHNNVLFGYDSLPLARFSDYDNWHIILNSVIYPSDGLHPPYLSEISDHVSRLVLKPSWKPSDWLRAVRNGTTNVQAHVETLNLAEADVIWCRSQSSKRELIKRDFDEDRIKVQKIKSAW